MQLDTIEQLDNIFDTEEKCILYLWNIRESVFNECPKCKCTRLYKIENNKKRKCGNHICSCKISVSVKSLIENTKLSLKEWFNCIFMYIKTKGRFSASSVSPPYTFPTSFMIDEKLKVIFINIQKNGVTNDWMFNEALRNIFILRGMQLELTRNNHYHSKYLIEPKEEMDLSDVATYNRVVLFSKKQLYYALSKKWIFTLFCSAEDLVSETFIAIAEGEPCIINGDYLVAMLRKTQNRMYGIYIKNNPKLSTWYENYRLEYRRMGRKDLRNWYLISLLYESDKTKGIWRGERTREDITKALQEKKEMIIKRRNKNNYNSNSEFLI